MTQTRLDTRTKVGVEQDAEFRAGDEEGGDEAPDVGDDAVR